MRRVILLVLAVVLLIPFVNSIDLEGYECLEGYDSSCTSDTQCTRYYTTPSPCFFNCDVQETVACNSSLECVDSESLDNPDNLLPGMSLCIDQDNGCVPYDKDYSCGYNKVCNPDTYLCEDADYVTDNSLNYVCSVTDFGVQLTSGVSCQDSTSCQGTYDGVTYQNTCLNGNACVVNNGVAMCLGTNSCNSNADCDAGMVCNPSKLECEYTSTDDLNSCTANWQCLEDQICNQGTCKDGVIVNNLLTPKLVYGGAFPNNQMFYQNLNDGRSYPVWSKFQLSHAPSEGLYEGLATEAILPVPYTFMNRKYTNCDDDDAWDKHHGFCRDHSTISYWGYVDEYNDPYQLNKLRRIDDGFGLYIFNQWGETYFRDKGANTPSIHVWEYTNNGLYDEPINLEPGWYNFVITYWDVKDSSAAEFGIGHAKNLNELFATKDGKLQIDSGNFLDAGKNPVSVRANYTNTIRFGTDAIDAIGLSFWAEEEIWHTINLGEGNWKNAISSCSNWKPSVDLRHLSENIIYVKSNHDLKQPVLCGLFVWSEEFENSQNTELEVKTVNLDETNQVITRLTPENVINDCGWYSTASSSLTLNGNGNNCGLVISDKVELGVNSGDLSILDGGVVQIKKFDISPGTDGFSMLYEEPITENFGFPIKGLIVSCDGNSNTVLQNRYSYRGNTLLFWPTDDSQECVVMAWSNVCQDCQEGAPCDTIKEGTIVTSVDDSEMACLWDESSNKKEWTTTESVFGQHIIVPHDKTKIGNQDRADMTSNGDKFYQCGFNIDYGAILTIPKSRLGSDIGDGTDPDPSSGSVDIIDFFADCSWNAEANGVDYVGQDCDLTQKTCVGSEFILNTDTPENVCCIGIPRQENNGDVCVENIVCEELNGVILEEGQGCQSPIAKMSDGGICCLDPDSVVNLPDIIESQALLCQEILGDGILFSCLNDELMAPSPYELYPGMSTTKVTNETHYELGNYSGNSNIPYLLNGNLTVDESFIHYPSTKFLRNDWSTAIELNLDVYHTLKEPTYFYLMSGNVSHPIINAKKFFKTGRVVQVSIPLFATDLNGNVIDYTNITGISLGHKDVGGRLNLWAVMRNLNLVETNTKYCGGTKYFGGTIKGFVNDYDNYTSEEDKVFSQYACESAGSLYPEYNPRSWTGNKCCGDDLAVTQSYTYNTVYQNIVQNSKFETQAFWSGIRPYGLYPRIENNQLRLKGTTFIPFPQQVTQTIPVSLESDQATLAFRANDETASGKINIFVSQLDSNQNILKTDSYEPEIYGGYITYSHNILIPNPLSTKYIRITIEKEYGIADAYFDYINFTTSFQQQNIRGFTVGMENYADFNGCFEGILFESNARVGAELGNQSQNDIAFIRQNNQTRGEFVQCDFYNESQNKYADYYETDNQGIPTNINLINSFSTACQNNNGLICTGLGWSRQDQPITFSLNKTMQGFSVGDKVYCENGFLKLAVEKKDWYLNSTGFCHQDMCYCPDYIESCAGPKVIQDCMFNNSFVNNNLCLNGEWTTRTGYAAGQILANTGLGDGVNGQNGVLHCGDVNTVLNNYQTDYITNACVYHNFDLTPKVIVAIPIPGNKLSDFVENEIKNEFVNLVEGNAFNVSTATSQLANGGTTISPDVGEYNYNISIYYDRNFKIVYVSNHDFFTTNWLEGIIRSLDNLFGGGVNQDTNYNDLYVFEDAGELVYGSGDLRYDSTTNSLTNKFNITYDLSNSDTLALEQFLSNRTNIYLTKSGDILKVTINSNNKKTWTSLTSATRINPR